MWLDPVRRALDARSREVVCFFRDDDAGWDDGALFALLDVFDRHAAPIDLAVIPDAIREPLAAALRARRHAAPHRLGWHQHGSHHLDHEAVGRKCEFGPSRTVDQQRADLVTGRHRLGDRLDHIDPIFTPPWNRCTQVTVDVLAATGCEALSRDATATPLDLRGMADASIRVDACKRTTDGSDPWVAVGRRMGEALADGSPAGVMLHHAVMSEADRARLDELLAVLMAHPRVRCALMRDAVALARVAPPLADA